MILLYLMPAKTVYMHYINESGPTGTKLYQPLGNAALGSFTREPLQWCSWFRFSPFTELGISQDAGFQGLGLLFSASFLLSQDRAPAIPSMVLSKFFNSYYGFKGHLLGSLNTFLAELYVFQLFLLTLALSHCRSG